ncbi:MAG: DedA family protein [Solirubrobacteraceae bacterium]|nr:DedA family protein [Solirubrobacteraceae bacterium]
MFIDVDPSLGYPALAALVFGESAGLPIPGETALIVSGGLAAAGHLALPLVILVAGLAATTGDMLGYWIGRRGGRKLLLRDGRFSVHRRNAVARADRYFERYGIITVFFARFVPGVRVVGALAAGATHMRWRSFAIANVLGCFTWATAVASFAYLAGPEGTIVLVVLGLTAAAVGFALTMLNARREAQAEPAAVTVEPPARELA